MDSSAQDLTGKLKEKITSSKILPEIQERLISLLKFSGSATEVEKLAAYIDFVTGLPFGRKSQDILDIKRAKDILDHNHYGLQAVKDRVLEYLSILILQRQRPNKEVFRAPVLAFIGLVGTGKTSIAYSIAESLGRPIIRIPFGGLGDPLQLRGQSRMRPDAEPGLIIKSVKSAGVDNPVILLDEIDRVVENARTDIMGVLVELLDPAQNHSFVDHYLDFSYDLSQILFIATANNTGNIATAVMDRLEPIQMPSYSDEEKMVIGKRYLFTKVLEETGVDSSKIVIEETVWPLLIRPLGFDAGIRSLTRILESVVRKVARKIVEGQPGPFVVNSQNVGEYITN